MKSAVIGFVIGVSIVLGIRVGSRYLPNPGAETTESAESADRGERLVKPNRPRRRALSSPPLPEPAHLEERDLERGEETIAHFYGEATGWDDPDVQASTRLHYQEGGEALMEAGLGELVELDCESYPCLGLVEAEGKWAKIVADIEQHLGMTVWTSVKVERDGRAIRRMLVEQRVEDISRWDPYMQMRKLDLDVMARSQELVSPDDAEAHRPIVWPD